MAPHYEQFIPFYPMFFRNDFREFFFGICWVLCFYDLESVRNSVDMYVDTYGGGIECESEYEVGCFSNQDRISLLRHSAR